MQQEELKVQEEHLIGWCFVSLATLQKIWQGPDMTWASGSGNTRTSWDYSGTSTNAQCPRWRWVTGPEQFLWNNRGLAFSPTRSRDNSPNANNGTWTRSSSTGGSIWPTNWRRVC